MRRFIDKIKKILVKISYALFHKRAGRYILIAFIIFFIGAAWFLHSNIRSASAPKMAKRHVISMQKDSASSQTYNSSDKKNSETDKKSASDKKDVASDKKSGSDKNNTSSDDKKSESNKKKNSSIKGSRSSAKKGSDKITEKSSGKSTEKSSPSSGNNDLAGKFGNNDPAGKSGNNDPAAKSEESSSSNGISDDKTRDSTADKDNVTVTLTIDISRISGENSKKLINQDDRERAASSGGTLLSTKLSMKDTDTVYDALVTSCQAAGIEMGARDSIYDMYVYEIDSFKEFDSGSASGWMYSVNGSFPQRSCSDYKLSDGDRIVWTYVNDYTNMT